MLKSTSFLHYFSFLVYLPITAYPTDVTSLSSPQRDLKIQPINSNNFLIADEDPSKGWSFCNHTRYPKIQVAVGYTIAKKRVSMGWQSALSKQCAKPLEGNRPEGLAYYAVARDYSGKIIKEWMGTSNNKRFCVRNGEAFRIILSGTKPDSDDCTMLKPFIPIPKSATPILTTIIK
jgi:uncharacterized membrane protein